MISWISSVALLWGVFLLVGILARIEREVGRVFERRRGERKRAEILEDIRRQCGDIWELQGATRCEKADGHS